ncbi:MAG: phosphoribosylformylglycinamidine synthase subunit PurL [Candidatus Omnitrophica bacterium]|nr:phosphoribosylformylglycinamidine synthase subunit PurL [Candidatus Omnitrophota bacterium]
MKTQTITPQIIKDHGLTPDEYERIVEILGREPNITELGLYSVMWSEHCSYKSSRVLLRQFPTTGAGVLIKAGEENAGAVDIGHGLAVVFKVESHNHPSAVEPYQGAATGVGGIIRDIFTMGARPIAAMDSLRFGDLKSSQSQHLLEGVVSGIAGYGNCVGVPTIGGDLACDPTYEGNPLVNAFCLGLVRHEDLARGAATGVGNPLIYVGPATGRDGLGGASFASRELTEESHEDRPAVQVGDPFTEKLLIEASLEALRTGVVVGIQDMGAAGLTCSVSETASRGGCGVEIDVAKVPRRETGMTPYEVLLSESQERMLLIVERGKEAPVLELFRKWGLEAVEIGEITEGNRMRVFENGELVADVPVNSLTDEAPVYHRPSKMPKGQEAKRRWKPDALALPEDAGKALLKLLQSPTVASKRWVWEQYDHMVQTNTEVLPGADAAVLRLKGTDIKLAMSMDGNGTYCVQDPYEGARLTTVESLRNLACAGAVPVGLTDCLNFGNPEDPEVFWQFSGCVQGIADVCKAWEIPVTGGNVSFYNESPVGAIDPTPMIAAVGVISGYDPVRSHFRNKGDRIYLLGSGKPVLGASEYLRWVCGLKEGVPARLDLKAERALHRLLVNLAKEGLVSSMHDVSEGGLAVALTESCISESKQYLGAVVDLEILGLGGSRADELLFGESATRVIMSCSPGQAGRIETLAAEAGVDCRELGEVGGTKLEIRGLLQLDLKLLRDTWGNALKEALGA